MNQLVDLISIKDVGEILEHVRAMIALVERDGSLVSWNQAFTSHKKNYPLAETLQGCFAETEKAKIYDRLSMNRQRRFLLEIETEVNESPLFCNCILVPLSDGRRFFIAERLETNSFQQEIVQRLNRRMKMFQVESEFAKKIARNKQIEVEGIVAQAREISNVDALTFLPNRRMIVRELQNEASRAERYHIPFSISVVDVDFFKKVNDTYGHLVGDEVLRQIGSLLRDHIRQPDLAGRYGGEEFLILLPNTEVAHAAEQAARLCKFVRECQVHINGHAALRITISMGVAQFRHGVDTWDSLLNRADTAMYEAKNSGRDRWFTAE